MDNREKEMKIAFFSEAFDKFQKKFEELVITYAPLLLFGLNLWYLPRT